MAKKLRKVLSLVLAVSMISGMGSIGAFADDQASDAGSDGKVVTTSADPSATDKTAADTGSAVTTQGQSVFTDVKTTDWFSAAVMWCYNENLMKGTAKDRFEPGMLTTRAMLVTTLYNMEGKPAVKTSGTFGDVASGKWYAAAVEWAAVNGIVTGYNGNFAPEAALTREDLVTIIHKYVAFKKADVSASADLSAYTDGASISGYAQDAIKWAVASDVVTGLTKTTIGPKATATRAQLAMILYKLRTTILTEINDEDTPLANLPDLPGSGNTSGGGSSRPSTTTVTIAAGDGAVFTAPTGWTANADGTYTASGRLNAEAIQNALNAATVTRVGYTFAGWTVEGTTATAQWTRNTVEVTVDLAGGTLVEVPENWVLNEDGTYTVTVNEGEDVNFEGVIPVREGYTFTGFENNAAQWTRNTVDVVIDLAGGAFETAPEGWVPNGNGTYTVTVNEGEDVNFDGITPVREGYTFTGFENNAAQWTRNTESVTVNLNGGTLAEAPEGWVLNEEGTYTVTVNEGDDVNFEGVTPVREGYTFTGFENNVAQWTRNTVDVVIDLAGGAFETAPEGWVSNGDGTYTVTVNEGADVNFEGVTPIREGYTFTGFENNVAQWEKDENAKTVTEDAVGKVQAVLEGITGHDGAQLVTLEGEDGTYAVTLDTDAIMAGEGAFDDELLNGLATKIGAALKEQFAGYTISVNDKIVYDENGSFNNTNLKEAIYDVASGFFYQLANMTPENGVYTYKTVKATVTNAEDGEDTYAFEAAINLKGDDVAKVQSLASVLEKHLSMTTMTAAEADKAFGDAMAKAPTENKYIVVEAEMPQTLINTAKDVVTQVAGEGADAQAIFNQLTVGQAFGLLESVPLGNVITSEQSGINSLVNILNNNANLVNKVLGKVEVEVNGQKFITNKTFAASSKYEDAWQNLMASVNEMIAGSAVLGTEVGSYAVGDGTQYMVPITVTIDLEKALGFKATETVLVVMDIDFGSNEPDVPAPGKAEEVTTTVITAVQNALEGITGHDGEQIVELTKGSDGAYAATLNADALQANSAVFSDEMLTGLATKVGEALKDFEGYEISVAGTPVLNEDGSINNTGLKEAMYEVAKGFFYKLSNMKEVDGFYTYGDPIAIVVENAKDAADVYETEIAVQLSGDDVARIVELSSTLEKHLSMDKMSAKEVKKAYGYVGSEETYFVVGAEMPDKLMDLATEIALKVAPEATSEEIQAIFNGLTVDRALSLLEQGSIDNIVGSGASGIETIINMIDNNSNLINKVLEKVEIEIDGETFISGKFEMGKTGDAWKDLVSGIHDMVGAEILASEVGEYAMGNGTEYLVPVTVTIDLEKQLGFTATETVLVVMNIAF